MIIGEKIRNARKSKGYSQQQLGDKLGVSKVSICSYEKGIRMPTIDNFLKLLDVLDVDPNYLLGRDVSVVSESEKEYVVKLAKEDLAIISAIKEYPVLYNKMCLQSKRMVELIDRKINK